LTLCIFLLNDVMRSTEEPAYSRVEKSSQGSRVELIEDMIRFFDQQGIELNIDRYELYLVLDEAITNAMEHGNRWIADKNVFVTIRRSVENPEHIVVKLKDEGLGFNPDHLPGQLQLNGALSPRGRGIYIIRKFCDVSFNAMGNEITMIFTEQKQ